MTQPHIVAIGGTLSPTSSTARALQTVLDAAVARGSRTTLLTGEAIAFPHYEPEIARADTKVAAFLDTLRSADALVIGSPGYHGTLSGMVKTMLDHVELTRGDPRIYFDGMPVGLVGVAGGWQAAMSTLGTLRTVTHALRGWPTPLGIAVNSADAACIEALPEQAAIMVDQIMGFLKA